MGFFEKLIKASPIVSAVGSFLGSERSNAKQEALSQKQMDFQERMSSTSYQRAVADMRSAGLNPMLAYSQGGASAPMGSMPQIQNSVSNAVSSAQSAQSTVEGVSKVSQNEALTKQVEAMTDKIKSETMTNEANTARLIAETRAIAAKSDIDEQEFDYRSTSGHGGNDARIRQLRAEIARAEQDVARGGNTFEADVRLRKAQAALAELEIPKGKSEAQFYESLGQASPWLRAIIELIKGGSSARQIFRR